MAKTNFARDQLIGIVDRIERLIEDKAAIAVDIKELYAEAKGNGFDPAIIKACIKLRAEDTAARQEREALTDLYMGELQGSLFDDFDLAGLGKPIELTAEERAAGLLFKSDNVAISKLTTE